MTARTQIIIRNEGLRGRVVELVQALNIEKAWRVTVEPYRKRRTLSQNALYWRWLDQVVQHVHEHTGHDKDEIHEFLKAKLLPARYVEIDGEVQEYRSTKHLNTAEMAAYTEKVYIWAMSELGLSLPLPEELHMIGPAPPACDEGARVKPSEADVSLGRLRRQS